MEIFNEFIASGGNFLVGFLAPLIFTAIATGVKFSVIVIERVNNWLWTQ